MKNTSKNNPNPSFTKAKFSSLTPERRHYHLALLCKQAYNALLQNEDPSPFLNRYAVLAGWIGREQLSNPTFESLSNCYHQHLQASSQKLKEHNLLPEVTTRDKNEVLVKLPIDIYLDNIRSAHNVGSIIRTTEAFSLGTIHFGGMTPTHKNKQVKDAAMGSEKWVDFRENSTLESLKRPIIVLETGKDAIPIHEFIFPETFTLIVGNEEYGCSETFLKNANPLIAIPLTGNKNSLNVANAFAIAASSIQLNRRKEK